MLNKIYNVFFVHIISFIFSFHAIAGFECALETSDEEISSIRHGVLSKRSFSVDGTSTAGTLKIFVSEPESLDEQLDNIPIEFAISGRLPRGIIDNLLQNEKNYTDMIRERAGSTIETTEFIFTGYGDGGKTALVLSALWAKGYQEITKKKPERNQIKAITFSASAVGDAEFNRSMKELLDTRNIVDFTPYFSRPTECGVPVRILPSEQLLDTVGNISSQSLIKTAGFLTLVASSCYLLKQSDGILNSTAINGIKIANLSATLWAGLTIYRSKFIPSEWLLLEAHRYARHNFSLNETEPDETLGSPPLFSSRRGIIGYLIRLIGI